MTKDKVALPVGTRLKRRPDGETFCESCTIVITGVSPTGKFRIYEYEPGGNHREGQHSTPANGRQLQTFLNNCDVLPAVDPEEIKPPPPQEDKDQMNAIQEHLRRPTPLKGSHTTYLKPQ